MKMTLVTVLVAVITIVSLNSNAAALKQQQYAQQTDPVKGPALCPDWPECPPPSSEEVPPAKTA